jgi:hypothetical protein
MKGSGVSLIWMSITADPHVSISFFRDITVTYLSRRQFWIFAHKFFHVRWDVNGPVWNVSVTMVNFYERTVIPIRERDRQPAFAVEACHGLLVPVFVVVVTFLGLVLPLRVLSAVVPKTGRVLALFSLLVLVRFMVATRM